MTEPADQPAATSSEAAEAVSERSRDEKRKAKLEGQLAETEAKIAETRERLDAVNAELGDADAQAIVKRHIKLLHQYNELKDIATGLFGLIAERRGVRVKELYEDFGVDEAD